MFEVPKLPYKNEALEPHIDAKTMEIHHDKHHQAYVDNLNKALALPENAAFSKLSLEQILANEKALAVPAIRNNAGGHYNHSFFWEIIGTIDQKHEGELLTLMNKSFESMDKFKEQFRAKALSVFGSGWVWLCKKDDQLILVGMPNQDNPLMHINKYNENGTPILGIDVWEHAYYLKYQNKRADYVEAFFHVINWKKVAEKLKK